MRVPLHGRRVRGWVVAPRTSPTSTPPKRLLVRAVVSAGPPADVVDLASGSPGVGPAPARDVPASPRQPPTSSKRVTAPATSPSTPASTARSSCPDTAVAADRPAAARSTVGGARHVAVRGRTARRWSSRPDAAERVRLVVPRPRRRDGGRRGRALRRARGGRAPTAWRERPARRVRRRRGPYRRVGAGARPRGGRRRRRRRRGVRRGTVADVACPRGRCCERAAASTPPPRSSRPPRPSRRFAALGDR